MIPQGYFQILKIFQLLRSNLNKVNIEELFYPQSILVMGIHHNKLANKDKIQYYKLNKVKDYLRIQHNLHYIIDTYNSFIHFHNNQQGNHLCNIYYSNKKLEWKVYILNSSILLLHKLNISIDMIYIILHLHNILLGILKYNYIHIKITQRYMKYNLLIRINKLSNFKSNYRIN